MQRNHKGQFYISLLNEIRIREVESGFAEEP